jgi:fructokinase
MTIALFCYRSIEAQTHSSGSLYVDYGILNPKFKMVVICLGEMLIDLLANQLGMPLEEVSDWTAYPGGAPANVACGLVKLGTPTALISCLGADEVGQKLAGLLTDIGVDVTGMQYSQTAPTRQVYVVRSVDGDRSFAGFINGLATDEFADVFLDAAQLPEHLFSQAKLLSIGTISLADPLSRAATDRALQLAYTYGLQIFVDVNWRSMFWDDPHRAKIVILDILNRADFIKMSDNEAEWLFDSIDPQIIRQQLPHSQGIFVTAGAKGCYYSLAHQNGFVPAFDVDAMDTTGAGDSFVAACIHQLCQQGIESIQSHEAGVKFIRYAAAAGAITTLHAGAIDAQPTDADIVKFLSNVDDIITESTHNAQEQLETI